VVATAQLGVRETGSNEGPEINRYLASVGLPPGYEWCAAANHWVHLEAARQLGIPNPHPKTPSALRIWELAPAAAKIEKPRNGRPWDRERLRPGFTFVEDHGRGHGHAGVVLGYDFEAGIYESLSGNTNAEGSRVGNAYAQNPRGLQDSRLIGLIDFSVVVQLVA
jgi:hypothetical protein